MTPFILLLSLALQPVQDAGPVTPNSDRLRERALSEAIEVEQARLLGRKDLFQDHSTWDKAWVVESKYYSVRTTHSRFLGLELANGLDMMMGHFQALLGTDFVPSSRVSVMVYPTIPEYNAFGQDNNGPAHSSFYGSYYSPNPNAIVALYDPNHVELKFRVTHSAFHHYVQAAFRRTPPQWLDEALAAYFAFYWSYPYCVSEHLRLVEGRRFVPLRTLLNSDDQQFVANSHDTFSEMATLVNYLRWRREETRAELDENGDVVTDPFGEYVQALMQGRATSGMEVHELLTSRLAELEADFRSYRFPE